MNLSDWWQMEAVEVWEAVGLSMGRMPMGGSSGPHDTPSPAQSAVDTKAVEELLRRLTIASSHLDSGRLESLQDRGPRPATPTMAIAAVDSRRVLLRTFAAWALSLNWEIPSELASMASASAPSIGNVSRTSFDPAVPPEPDANAGKGTTTKRRPLAVAKQPELREFLRVGDHPNQVEARSAAEAHFDARIDRDLIRTLREEIGAKKVGGRPRKNPAENSAG